MFKNEKELLKDIEENKEGYTWHDIQDIIGAYAIWYKLPFYEENLLLEKADKIYYKDLVVKKVKNYANN